MNEIINIENVTFGYKGADEKLLNNVSLSINEGEMILLCGASGSGKTTIIRLINGLIPHYYNGVLEGDVTVAGRDIRNTELYELAGVVGTVFQNPRSQFFSVDTDGEIVFGPENIGIDPDEIKRRSDNVTKEMEIRDLLGKSLFELSGGEKQKIACASVSALLPSVILLDEPSSNLDIDSITKLKDQIALWKKQGKTIIISEHRLWYLTDLADRVLYMHKGVVEHEWTGSEFASLSRSEINKLKLRPLSIEQSLTDNDLTEDDIGPDAVSFEGFCFAYKERPHVFRRKDFSEYSEEELSLNIPKVSIPAGSVVGIVGHNGMGKSTFLRCVCGLQKRCRGSIRMGDKVYSGKERLQLCYMVMQDVNHQLFTDSVEAEVMLSMGDKDEKKCHEILESLGLLVFKDKHPMALSGGQKQRVAVASAIASGAKLLLFDEPTSGLDYAHMEKVGTLLRELASRGSTVMVVTHDPELIATSCDYVMCIEEGKVRYLRKVIPES